MRLFVYRGMRHGFRPAYMEVSLSFCCFNSITCTDWTVELLNGVPEFFLRAWDDLHTDTVLETSKA